MQPELADLAWHREAQELETTWAVRALRHTRSRSLGITLLSVLAHNFDEAMPVLLRVAFPGFVSITAPFLITAGRIGKNGQVTADLVEKDGRITRAAVLYKNETALRDEFRWLADGLKLDDKDRIELFKCVQRWVVADTRLDPNLDPLDPDAKRLTN